MHVTDEMLMEELPEINELLEIRPPEELTFNLKNRNISVFRRAKFRRLEAGRPIEEVSEVWDNFRGSFSFDVFLTNQEEFLQSFGPELHAAALAVINCASAPVAQSPAPPSPVASPSDAELRKEAGF